jgi:hypothetical protein
MNQNFDLNINNYTLKELEEFFGLNYNNYNEESLSKQETKLKLNILNDKNVSSTTKNNTLQFLSEVRKKLLNHIKTISTPIYMFEKSLDKGLHKSEIMDVGSATIIKQSNTSYSNSFPSEFYQGSINPLSKRILRQNVNIDTRFRSNYYATNASNFNVDLPLKISQVVSLQLSALEFPSTFYIISQVFGNNFFVLEITGEPLPLIVTIPDGNYDYLSLQEYINNYLQTVGTGNYQNIRFLSDINTPLGSGPTAGSGRMVVGSTSGSIAFSLNFLTDRYGNEDRQTPLPLKLGWLMGFREGYYENALTYVSEGIINLLGPRYIYLVVDDFNNNVNDGFYAAFSSSVLNKNILARISLQGTVFNLLSKDNFNLITSPRQYFGPVDIQKLQIQLLDEYGRILNLNNMDYSFCLTFQTIYEL